MAKLSRKERFKELREQIERDMSESSVEIDTPRVKLSRTDRENDPTHAKRNVHAHVDEDFSQIISPYGTQTSSVMDDLLGEVKQYNIDNGNRFTDDTQINILKQLDGTSYSARNQHIMPMDEEEEALGSTMEMPRTSSITNMDIDGVATFLPNQKLTRVNPITLSSYDDFKEEEEEPFKIGFDEVETVKQATSKQPKLVLGNDDIISNTQQTDAYDIFEPGKIIDDFDRTEERPIEKKKKIKKKKAKKERKVEEELPSAKIRMVAGDVENEEEEKETNKSSTILNVILGILVIALLASIGFTVYFLMHMGA